ncbi:MAG: hypothetical protein H6728_04235 [Myxococcales bacterium]|nr:hypothetical protein [Myxococcales bacterium]
MVLGVSSTQPQAPQTRRSRAQMWMRWIFGSLLLSWTLGACGPQDTVMWDTKTYDQRLTWMGTEVVGAMGALFVEFDPARYKDNFSCETCHGKDGPSLKYKMPNKVFPMDPNNPITENDSDPQLAKYAKFMKEKVMPEMKRLLGKQDITCNLCHAAK